MISEIHFTTSYCISLKLKDTTTFQRKLEVYGSDVGERVRHWNTIFSRTIFIWKSQGDERNQLHLLTMFETDTIQSKLIHKVVDTKISLFRDDLIDTHLSKYSGT